MLYITVSEFLVVEMKFPEALLCMTYKLSHITFNVMISRKVLLLFFISCVVSSPIVTVSYVDVRERKERLVTTTACSCA